MEKKTRNKTISLSENELHKYKEKLLCLKKKASVFEIINKTINQDIFQALPYLPHKCIDLVFVDPPYNMKKSFAGEIFKELSSEDYAKWLDSWLKQLIPLLKENASVYICGDWRSSAAIYNTASQYLYIQNRITFEREKGKGAKKNWKNCSEDIWFCTLSKDDFCFNVDAVKLKKKVIAPYKDEQGKAKDWYSEKEGQYRLTHPSNLWTDISIPFWSMPENTEHPTQKPEKLLAKIILAATNENDLILDPFLGSGTTSVVAKKLGRNYVGIELSETYCCLAEKRLEFAESNKNVQGFYDGVFWERNSFRSKQQSAQTIKNKKKDESTTTE